MLRDRFISFVNLFGLIVGLSCCLLILAYISNEMSFDRSNPKASRIYRVTRIFYGPDGSQDLHLSSVAPPFGPLLQHDFPQIQDMTRLFANGSLPLSYKEKIFNQPEIFFADAHFFDFFNVPVLNGEAKTALLGPYQVMMTPEVARKFFGNADPVGKVIRLGNIQQGFRVSGIFRDFPQNSHFHPSVLISFNTLQDRLIYGEKQLETNWGNNAFYTYLLLAPGYPPERLEQQFPGFFDRNMHFDGIPSGMKVSKTTGLTLEKLTDIHLKSHLDDELEANGDIRRIYIFSIVAFFILLIACVNYMNLASARAALRAREIGVRKAIGAARKEIIFQFLGESILMVAIALVFAVIIARMALPWVNRFANTHLDPASLSRPWVWGSLLLIPVVVGIISGIYPALFLSSFRPSLVLKGTPKVGGGNISLRKALVVFQFSISIILIIATLVVFQQLHFVENTSLGYDRSHVVVTHYPGAIGNHFENFRTELLRNPRILGVARSSRIPTGRLLDELDAKALMGNKMQPLKISLKFVVVDPDFLPVYGIHLLAGRNFDRSYLTDSASFILNDAAVRAMNWKSPRLALGKEIDYGGVDGTVIGIVHDFNFESLHQRIVPLLLATSPEDQPDYNQMSVRIAGTDIAGSLNYLKKTWARFLPELPLEYSFLDDRFAQQYQAEQKEGSLFTIFSSIAIFIACLGLFGLASFTIAQRSREIGIRKVMGAGVGQLVSLLSMDFMKLVLVAMVVSIPIAWFSMNQWLDGFAYKIHVQAWVLILACCAAAMVALCTVGFQAVKASLANPARNLRTE